MEPIKCPHCGKELDEPLFRFCNHCNGNIQALVKAYNEKMKKQRIEDFTASEAKRLEKS